MHRTHPLAPDTDGDGLQDGVELAGGTDPLLVDTDGDLLWDGEELASGTDPLLGDTDGDGLDDGTEVLLWQTSATEGDTDGDTLGDAEEIRVLGTDPLRANGLTVVGPLTPVAGASTVILAVAAPPNDTLRFFGGTSVGATPVPGCPGLNTSFTPAIPIGSATTTAGGRAVLSITIPSSLGGRLIALQAVDSGCGISPVNVVQIQR